MLYNECVEAWKIEAEEFNDSLRQARTNGVTYGKVPAELEPWEYEFLLRLYSRNEFDAMCTGHDRHLKFARWACRNYGAWTRLIEREYQRMFENVTAAAASWPVPRKDLEVTA